MSARDFGDCFVCERIARGLVPDRATARMHDEYHWRRRVVLEEILEHDDTHESEAPSRGDPYRRVAAAGGPASLPRAGVVRRWIAAALRRLAPCLALACAASGCEDQAEVRRQEEEQHEREKRMDRFYDAEWVRCVNELGVERCRLIQETGMWQCRAWSYGSVSGISGCAVERFEERHEDQFGDLDKGPREGLAPGPVEQE